MTLVTYCFKCGQISADQPLSRHDCSGTFKATGSSGTVALLAANTPDYRFRCNVCGRAFATHGAISTHDRSHTAGQILGSIGNPQSPREPISEGYAFLLANVRDAVAEDDNEPTRQVYDEDGDPMIWIDR